MAIPSLPKGLVDWCDEHGWRVHNAQRVQGSYAAKAVLRIRAVTDSGQENTFIYKQFAGERARELELYTDLTDSLRDYAPALIGRVITPTEEGIVLEDAGEPLSAWLQHPATSREQLLRTAEWLADMHAGLERAGAEHFSTGRLTAYPVRSAYEWARQSLDALNKLVWDVPAVGISKENTRAVSQAAERLYVGLDQWMTGRMTLTHGDPHFGNILCKNSRRTLIDWEFAHWTVPHRDLSVYLQEITLPDVRRQVVQQYALRLARHGWDTEPSRFYDTLAACLFDNTLMMLGWDIHRYRTGELSEPKLETILSNKLHWMKMCVDRLDL